MESSDSKILKSYFGLLSGLSDKLKLDLIKMLNQSVNSEGFEKSRMKASFGAWKSEESAEEIISQIESSRLTNRQIEGF